MISLSSPEILLETLCKLPVIATDIFADDLLTLLRYVAQTQSKTNSPVSWLLAKSFSISFWRADWFAILRLKRNLIPFLVLSSGPRLSVVTLGHPMGSPQAKIFLETSYGIWPVDPRQLPTNHSRSLGYLPYFCVPRVRFRLHLSVFQAWIPSINK
jgi:hypothetical protein